MEGMAHKGSPNLGFDIHFGPMCGLVVPCMPKKFSSTSKICSPERVSNGSKHSCRQGNLKMHYLKEVAGFGNLQVLAHNVCHCCTDLHIDLRVWKTDYLLASGAG